DLPLTLRRAELEARLAADAAPQDIARLRAEYARVRREVSLAAGERAQLDAIEGRLVAASDPAAAQTLSRNAITAADALGIAEVAGTKARLYAYRTLLLLAAKQLDAEAVLALFAAADRAAPRDGCALGAMIDGEQLLLLARGTGGFRQ